MGEFNCSPFGERDPYTACGVCAEVGLIVPGPNCDEMTLNRLMLLGEMGMPLRNWFEIPMLGLIFG